MSLLFIAGFLPGRQECSVIRIRCAEMEVCCEIFNRRKGAVILTYLTSFLTTLCRQCIHLTKMQKPLLMGWYWCLIFYCTVCSPSYGFFPPCVRTIFVFPVSLKIKFVGVLCLKHRRYRYMRWWECCDFWRRWINGYRNERNTVDRCTFSKVLVYIQLEIERRDLFSLTLFAVFVPVFMIF